MIIEQPNGGGIAGFTTPQIAYVQSDGDDGTAEIGNPATPFLTAQAAYDAGARWLQLGANFNAGEIVLDSPSNFRILGWGIDTIINFDADGNNLEIVDVGVMSFLATVTTGGGVGVDAGNAVLYGGQYVSIETNGASGEDGTPNGSSAGGITIYGPASIQGNITANGGTGWDDLENPSNGGNGGNITMLGTVIQGPGVLECTGGQGPNGGVNGSNGTITLTNGPQVVTPNPNTATVVAAIVNGTFYDNAYP